MQESIHQALRSGAFDQALALAREWADAAPDSAPAQRALAVVLAQAGDAAAALVAMDAAIALAPEDAGLQFERAALLARSGQPEAARLALDETLGLDPNHLPAYLAQAQLALLRGDLDAAARLARTAARIDPDHPRLAAVEALLALRQGDAARALALASAASERLPDDPQLLSALGFAYLARGHWAFAEQAFRKVSALLPDARALQSGRVIPSTTVAMHHRASDRMVWISATCVPVFTSGGSEADHVFILFTDVTELKRDNTLFSRAQSLAHIGGWEWDRAQQHLYLTDEARRILDAPAGPVALDALLSNLRSEDRRRLETAVQGAHEGAGSFDLELQGHRGNGRLFWIRVIGEAEPGNYVSTRVSGTLQDITERKLAEETLRVQARTDPLTTIMNRDAILAELESRLQEPAHCQLAVLYVDLDRFKTVNDMLGHAAGDELLVRTAQRMAAAVGTEGLLARFGGDEFLVVCNADDGPEQATRLAQAILETLSRPFRFGEDEFSVSASIGIAYAPQDGTRPQQLIQNADAAMYDCKHRSRNAWQVFTPDLAQRQQDRLLIETQLRKALDNNEFRLVYQPQVDLRHGHIVSAEALIRWESTLLGNMRPDLFISHAETTGDIVRIGDWVLREACRQSREWRDQGLGVVPIAINVSYRQFVAEDLAQKVYAALNEFDLPGSALELEFTERVLIDDSPATMRTFAELWQMGVMLSIDDFGEGYSALNYLRRLPIHGLKLSQLFVAGVPTNRSDVAVCEAVSGIARSLGLGMVAEGVESEAQRRFLVDLGVPVGQGFLFAPGLPADEFARRLAAQGPFGN